MTGLDNVMNVPSTRLDCSVFPGSRNTLDTNTAAFNSTDKSWMVGLEVDSVISMLLTLALSYVDTLEHDPVQFPSNNYDLLQLDTWADDPYSGSSMRCQNDDFRPSRLHIAVQKGNCRVLRLLLEHGADCDSKDAAGFTPLICATIRGHEDMVMSPLITWRWNRTY